MHAKVKPIARVKPIALLRTHDRLCRIRGGSARTFRFAALLRLGRNVWCALLLGAHVSIASPPTEMVPASSPANAALSEIAVAVKWEYQGRNAPISRIYYQDAGGANVIGTCEYTNTQQFADRVVLHREGCAITGVVVDGARGSWAFTVTLPRALPRQHPEEAVVSDGCLVVDGKPLAWTRERSGAVLVYGNRNGIVGASGLISPRDSKADGTEMHLPLRFTQNGNAVLVSVSTSTTEGLMQIALDGTDRQKELLPFGPYRRVYVRDGDDHVVVQAASLVTYVGLLSSDETVKLTKLTTPRHALSDAVVRDGVLYALSRRGNVDTVSAYRMVDGRVRFKWVAPREVTLKELTLAPSRGASSLEHDLRVIGYDYAAQRSTVFAVARSGAISRVRGQPLWETEGVVQSLPGKQAYVAYSLAPSQKLYRIVNGALQEVFRCDVGCSQMSLGWAQSRR